MEKKKDNNIFIPRKLSFREGGKKKIVYQVGQNNLIILDHYAFDWRRMKVLFTMLFGALKCRGYALIYIYFMLNDKCDGEAFFAASIF